MTVEKPKPEQLLRPITTGTNSAMNQSQSLAITCNSLEAREKSRVHGGGFASHWLKNWRDSFKPITKRSNCNHVITFDGHLKTALSVKFHSTVKRQWITKQTFPAIPLVRATGCRRGLNDDGLTLETSALILFYSGYLTLINLFFFFFGEGGGVIFFHHCRV